MRQAGVSPLGWIVGCGLTALLSLHGIGADEFNRKTTDQERELVQRVHESRDAYQASLERLRAYYLHVHNEEGQQWAERELRDYHLSVKNPYLMELDLPSADLKADTSLPIANRIFREALDWLSKRTISTTERDENFKRAELLFRRIVRDYPRSDKLDEACYYLGEIYSSKYFQQYRRAAAFYERVFLYEPNTNLDARLRAAMLYERYLADRKHAVELYQDILSREVDPVQTKEARKRLDELLGTKQASRQ